MSKRALSDVSSPRSDSECDEIRRFSGGSDGEADVPLPNLWPPSVTGSDQNPQFGACVDGVPISLPVPRPNNDDDSEPAAKRRSDAHSASPNAVSATPQTSRQSGGTTSSAPTGLHVIPESDESEVELQHREIGGSTPGVDAAGDGEGRIDGWPAAVRDDRSGRGTPGVPEPVSPVEGRSSASPTLQHQQRGFTAVAAAAPSSSKPSGLKRRNVDSGGCGNGSCTSESPERTRTRTRPHLEVDDDDEEGHTAGAASTAGEEGGGVDSVTPFNVDVAVELPRVSPSIRFGVRELDTSIPSPSTSSDAPFLSLRPPSVSGCPVPLRFGDDNSSTEPTPSSATSLPLPTLPEDKTTATPTAQ